MSIRDFPILKQKSKIAGLHFLGSLILLSICGYVVFSIWYMQPFSTLFNVKVVFILMFFIDVILGPLLTFIVYKQGKKTLKLDLAVIICIQLIALGWGMWKIAEARPAWLAVYKDTVTAVSPAYLSNPENHLDINAPSIFEQNWLRPKLVMIPEEDKTPNSVYQYKKYTDYDSTLADKYKLPLSKIETFDKNFYTQINNDYPNATGYLPIITEASMDIAIILLDTKGEPIDTVIAKKIEK